MLVLYRGSCFRLPGKKNDAQPNTGDYTVPNVNTPKIDSLTLSFEAQTLKGAKQWAMPLPTRLSWFLLLWPLINHRKKINKTHLSLNYKFLEFQNITFQNY